MARIYLPLFLLLLLVIEGVALDFLPQRIFSEQWIIIPHWLLVFLLMIAVFYDFENTYFSVLYAIIFGMLIDIVYTNVLGVYMFSYALVVYIIHGMKKLLHLNLFVVLLYTVIGISLADFFIFTVYLFIGADSISWEAYASTRLLPTLIANGLFLFLIYPINRKLIQWSIERDEKAKSS
ncbi:rod shape-determining protein MreD [Aquibacillus sediminis]|uniref:rod shape-determining protein MreD n=1 Tax=Aquibacillus sediminis TaxID=2574734 RepID=UPI001486DC9A|nr:rod shape-determining protein MreD [Aquibacillus sediminis]